MRMLRKIYTGSVVEFSVLDGLAHVGPAFRQKITVDANVTGNCLQHCGQEAKRGEIEGVRVLVSLSRAASP